MSDFVHKRSTFAYNHCITTTLKAIQTNSIIYSGHLIELMAYLEHIIPKNDIIYMNINDYTGQMIGSLWINHKFISTSLLYVVFLLLVVLDIVYI